MYYTSKYSSPIGNILIAASNTAIVGVWIEGQKNYAKILPSTCQEKETTLITKLKQWLDLYFAGEQPNFSLPVEFIGTQFQKDVWQELEKIPYGTTTTYKQIAKNVATKRNVKTISCQAVGTAIGKNNISIIVPCHRVVATSGSLSGYDGGINKKIALLKLEGSYSPKFFIPKNLLNKNL